MNKFDKFVAILSPSDRTGIIAILSGIPGVVAQFGLHNAGLSSLITLLTFGITKILVPDNTVTTENSNVTTTKIT
jgi:hypothetical protein